MCIQDEVFVLHVTNRGAGCAASTDNAALENQFTVQLPLQLVGRHAVCEVTSATVSFPACNVDTQVPTPDPLAVRSLSVHCNLLVDGASTETAQASGYDQLTQLYVADTSTVPWSDDYNTADDDYEIGPLTLPAQPSGKFVCRSLPSSLTFHREWAYAGAASARLGATTDSATPYITFCLTLAFRD
jgi:hypothetical protein